MNEDDELEFDDEESPDILSEGLTVLIESQDQFLYIGTLLQNNMAGTVIAQTHREISMQSPDAKEIDLEKLKLSNPVVTLIPWSNVSVLKRFEDFVSDQVLTTFRDQLDNFNRPEPQSTDAKQSVWMKFLEMLDRVLKKIGW